MNKKKLIILEGSDGSGKSTIAARLEKETGFKLEHHGPVSSYLEGKMQYFHEAYRINESTIKDRFYFGEAIFAPLYRGYDGSEYFESLEDLLMERFDVLLVLVTAPYEIIIQRINERGEDFVEPEHFKICYDKAREVFNKSKLPKIIVDTHNDSLTNNVEKIRKLVFTNMY